MLDGSREIRREVVGDFREQRQRDVADAVVRVNAPALSLVLNDDGHSGIANLDVQHLCVVMDERADLERKAVHDLVHAADGLKERRLPLVLKRLVKAKPPKLRTEKFF